MITVNGLIVHTMRWLAGWSGPWVAEIDYAGDVAPSGKVAIVSTEGLALVGTVDGDRSGVFGEKRQLRVVGGGDGWRKKVRAQHYHSDIGVNLAVLVSTTAAEAGEVAVVAIPKVLGVDFARSEKLTASQIFEDAGVDWWVGLDGVTRVGIRVPSVQPLSLQILDWHPSESTVSFTCETLVEPGTIVLDTRFGSKIVREVDARIDGGSVSGTLWLAEAPPKPGETVNELVDAMGALARASTRAEYSRFYEYIVIAMSGDRVELKCVNPSEGMPDILPGSVWAGASGYKATLTPSSRVLVGFRGGDPSRPFVAFYEPPEGLGWRPVVLELDAVASLAIGAQAASVVIGSVAGAYPVARVTPAFAQWIAAVTVAINGLAPGSAVAPIDVPSTKVVSS